MDLLRGSRTLRFGVPMLLLIIGGSFGLREFAQVRYDVQKVKRKVTQLINTVLWEGDHIGNQSYLMDPALEAQLKKNKDKITLESEYQKLPEPNSDWVNIRGPRPWEDSKAAQEQQRKIQIGNGIK
ncbi:cytochrome c oxidase assembly protein COX16 homolog, mitochondrial isoform X1 [Pristis pectinata]|uniref:cytochrome c oxidase assembly protein COX16 homolog, mitochondrial isoform X1 n=1 Tax=Pristis pectinata TaxID=685728 RepID=UPI00223CC927|nr:cytochrome c oxidase assembly protein COX16 homolog, mitochondrial isoform X1 [Pristis pectinata]